MNNLLKKNIGQALRESTFAYAKNIDDIQLAITKEMDMSSMVWRIECCMDLIIHSNTALFVVGSNRFTKHKYIKPSKQGTLFINALKTPISEIKNNFPIHKFNPLVELYFRNIEERHLYELPWAMNALSDADVVKSVDILNGCIESIRQEANGTKFKKVMAEFQRMPNKNYRGLLKYIDALFEKHSRLLVIRLDLGYLKKQGWPYDVDNDVKFDDVKKHWGKMLRFLSTKLHDNCLVGFAYKLEYGLEKHFHIHLLIFLDGSKVREDVTIARMFGEKWNIEVTDGKGLYYNCNAFKEGYKTCGIGMVSHDSEDLREGLKKAALYMTKTDFYIKMVAPGNGRTFGKGIMPKPKGNRGRPREKMQDKSEGSGHTSPAILANQCIA